MTLHPVIVHRRQRRQLPVADPLEAVVPQRQRPIAPLSTGTCTLQSWRTGRCDRLDPCARCVAQAAPRPVSCPQRGPSRLCARAERVPLLGTRGLLRHQCQRDRRHHVGIHRLLDRWRQGKRLHLGPHGQPQAGARRDPRDDHALGRLRAPQTALGPRRFSGDCSTRCTGGVTPCGHLCRTPWGPCLQIRRMSGRTDPVDRLAGPFVVGLRGLKPLPGLPHLCLRLPHPRVTRWRTPRSVWALAVRFLLRSLSACLLGRLLQGRRGSPRRARSGHTCALATLVLPMEHLRGMVGPQRVLDVMQSPSACITGRWDHLTRHLPDGSPPRGCPRLRLPVRGLRLQQDTM